MTRTRAANGAACWLLLLGLAGCQSDDRGSVRGRVKLDGQLLDDATISFVPQGGSQMGAAWTKVENGEYAIAVPRGPALGKHRVEIRAVRQTGTKRAPSNPVLAHMEAEFEVQEVVPPRYNTKSELTAEIKAGDNVADFDLKSK